MKNDSPKHIAFKTLIKHKCYSLNKFNDIKNIIESYQFTIIEYKKHNNSEPVSELIKKLKIENEIEQNDCFLYVNKNLKFIFINSSVSDEDKCSLLRHELGHICDTGFIKSDLHYSAIKKEEFANEFSCHTKRPSAVSLFCVFWAKKWKLLVCLFALLVCILALFFLFKAKTGSPSKPAVGNDISYNIYYVTTSGEKYHRNNCIIVKYKNNLTQIKLSDALNDGYTPCKICNPDT